MKYTNTSISEPNLILFNDHYVAIPYDCSSLSALAINGVIPAGKIVPSNDGDAIGVLLNDVVLAENPNGTVVVHGFVKQAALPTAPTYAAINTLRSIVFMDSYNHPQPQKYAVTYDLNGATGTAVVDSSSPYTYGSTVTVANAPTVTVYPEGTTQFDKWNTKADGTGTSYAAAATFSIADNTKLYAIYKA